MCDFAPFPALLLYLLDSFLDFIMFQQPLSLAVCSFFAVSCPNSGLGGIEIYNVFLAKSQLFFIQIHITTVLSDLRRRLPPLPSKAADTPESPLVLVERIELPTS